MEITLKEVEVTKLNLQPGDTLMVTVKSDEVDESLVYSLCGAFKKQFPNNEVGIICVSSKDDVRYSVVSSNIKPQTTIKE